MASSQYGYETPPRTAGRNRFGNSPFTPSQQLGGRDPNDQVNQGYELPPELRQVANAGFGGGGFGQVRQQEQYVQSGFQSQAAPGTAGVSGSVAHGQYQGRSQAARGSGSRGSVMMGRPAGGVGDTQQVPQSTEHLGPIPRAARIVNENLMAEKRYPDLDTIVSRESLILTKYIRGGLCY